MADAMPQNYENHHRWVPMYHFVLSVLFLANALYAIYRVIAGFSLESVINLTTAVALIFLYFFTRSFPNAVQDRVIRLEERLRFERILPDDLKPRTGEFSVDRLVGLRFAGDAELSDLAREVLDGNIQDREEIKKRVKEWRADHVRA